MTNQICSRCEGTRNERLVTHEVWCKNHYLMFLLEVVDEYGVGRPTEADQGEYARLCGLMGHYTDLKKDECDCESVGCY